VGAAESAVTVKFELALPPALFAAETLFEPGSAAVGVNEYVRVAPDPDTDQLAPIAPAVGKVYPAMPVSLSVELAVRSNPPLAALGLMKTWVPEPE
jgi:hypothetical protein